MHFPSIVGLNIGGTVFRTSLQTLQSVPDCFFGRMFSSSSPFSTSAQLDPAGNYFIDRDGAHFSYVLNFLRDGTVDLPGSALQRQQLLKEAMFYQIEGLTALLQGKITLDDASVSPEGGGAQGGQTKRSPRPWNLEELSLDEMLADIALRFEEKRQTPSGITVRESDGELTYGQLEEALVKSVKFGVYEQLCQGDRNTYVGCLPCTLHTSKSAFNHLFATVKQRLSFDGVFATFSLSEECDAIYWRVSPMGSEAQLLANLAHIFYSVLQEDVITALKVKIE